MVIVMVYGLALCALALVVVGCYFIAKERNPHMDGARGVAWRTGMLVPVLVGFALVVTSAIGSTQSSTSSALQQAFNARGATPQPPPPPPPAWSPFDPGRFFPPPWYPMLRRGWS